jgi:5'-nucleotidase / UDP-sugar diphosphatase
MMLRKLAALSTVVVVFSYLLAKDGEKAQLFELTIIHTNDNHANHEPQASGDGGDARQATVIKQIRASVRNHLTVDAGDRFMGTLFHTEYHGLDNVPFLNMIGFQALALGNHEFDEGDEGLANFASRLDCPVLAANVDVSRSKLLNGKIKPFAIVTVGGEKIGIIGLATIDTKTGSRPSKDVDFDKDYAGIVQKYVDQLEKKDRINKIVVLSHIGLQEDLKLAGQVSGVDAIVGGHSHTLLSKTYREAKNTYPMKVTGKDGNPVYVVQAGGGDNRFVGKLDLEFDVQGRVVKAGGDTILLSKYIAPDLEIKAEVAKLAKPIDALKKKPIVDKNNRPVVLNVDLPNTKVRDEETLLGDLMADAMRIKAKSQIAIMGGGGLRAGLAKGELTYGDIYRVLPFTNKLSAFRLAGADLLATLEHGVSRYGESGNGRFLQVSGLRYAFEPAKEKGRRVLWAEVFVDSAWTRIDPKKEYFVAADNYIRSGGDDFAILRDRAIEPDEDLPPVQDVFVQYLRERSPVAPRLEGRIRIVK